MQTYKRSREGQIFFTLVTHQRRNILTTELGRDSLRKAIRNVRKSHPFQILGVIILPDHLHMIWQLPWGDTRYPMRWRLIKREFTIHWLKGGGNEGILTEIRRRKGERGIWQRRYYEHTC